VEVNGTPQPFDAELRQRALATCRDLSAAGHRLLAVASRPVEEKTSYSLTEERDLVLAGFLAFLDPPRPDAAEALRDLKRDGVRVKVLTGDNELVAKHISGQVGLDGNRVVLGADLDRLGDAALAHVAERATVFARVSPAQKNRILRALQARGHVVGFLGDGVNDAPSIHAADVGISVASAVDVARDAAEVILLEQGLRVLHSGIVEGRQAFGNVLKYLLMGTSSNFGNMISMALATVFLPFLPMLPMQVLLNNLLYDLAQLPIPTDTVDPILVRRPHRWDIGLIRRFMLRIGPISSVFDFLTFGVLLWCFHATEAFFHTGWFVESLATQTLVLLVIRTAGNPFRSRPSRPLLASVIGIVVVGMLLPYMPLALLLGFVPLPASYFAFLVGATALYLGCVDVVKRRVFRRFLQEGFNRNHESHE
jgi:Mg2+-importing ATPase